MKIATIGTGGIGGYLAVKLTLNGHEVAAVARGAHLSAIQKNGLTLATMEGVENIRPWKASDETESIGPVDAIIFGVKCHALDQAAKACLPMLHNETIVVPFLNGVEAPERLSKFLPKQNIANGIAKISTTIAEPGIIRQVGSFAQFIFSECDSKPSLRIRQLQSIFRNAGIDAPETEDIDCDLWSKFVLFSSMSGVTAAARCTVGDIRSSKELSNLAQAIMIETANVGRAKGIKLPNTLEKDLWTSIETLPADMRASTAIDLENNRPLETPWVSGAAVRLAREAGVSAKLNEAIFALLSPFEKGAKRSDSDSSC